jgi:hypothetical protein
MTVQQTLLAISALAIALIVASCGGSGSSAPSPTPAPDPNPEPEPDAPFGLTVRQSLANFTLPVQSGAGNAFALQSAFRIKDLIRRPMLRVSRGRIASWYSNGAVAFVHLPTSDKASVHA